ncbi:MAG: hypothetical protein JKP97_04140 [Rhodobacteraceae bacterium]|jgi:hypothetical protein|nr:hypothetical protein [Paracoccaceae bacterium]
MLAMVPAMIALTLVITLVFVFGNRPAHYGTAALAENMARYHNTALAVVTAPGASHTVRLLSDAALQLVAITPIAEWRSAIVEIPGGPHAGQRYLITYPGDYATNSRFDRRDFAEIPFILRRNNYTTAIYGAWSDSIGITDIIDISGVDVTLTTTPPIQTAPIVDELDNLTPMLMNRVQ